MVKCFEIWERMAWMLFNCLYARNSQFILAKWVICHSRCYINSWNCGYLCVQLEWSPVIIHRLHMSIAILAPQIKRLNNRFDLLVTFLHTESVFCCFSIIRLLQLHHINQCCTAIFHRNCIFFSWKCDKTFESHEMFVKSMHIFHRSKGTITDIFDTRLWNCLPIYVVVVVVTMD